MRRYCCQSIFLFLFRAACLEHRVEENAVKHLSPRHNCMTRVRFEVRRCRSCSPSIRLSSLLRYAITNDIKILLLFFYIRCNSSTKMQLLSSFPIDGAPSNVFIYESFIKFHHLLVKKSVMLNFICGNLGHKGSTRNC